MAPTNRDADATPAQPLDLEAHRTHHIKRSASRASLPLSVHQPSTPASEPATQEGDGPGPAEEGHPEGGDEEYAWGPQHPCFPHRNPHVPLDSPLYESTRIIRIKRDWMVAGDLAPTFANLYPEVLDPLVSEESFRRIVGKVNNELVAAFSPWTARAWVDALMGLATGWLWDDFGFAAVKGRLRRLEEWIAQWNRGEGARECVQIIPLRRTGYMTLDFQIPDPQIGVDTAPPDSQAGAPAPAPTSPPAADSSTLDTQRHGELGPARAVQDLGALRAGGMQYLPGAVAAR